MFAIPSHPPLSSTQLHGYVVVPPHNQCRISVSAALPHPLGTASLVVVAGAATHEPRNGAAQRREAHNVCEGRCDAA